MESDMHISPSEQNIQASLTPERIGWFNELGFVFDVSNERLFNKTKSGRQKVDEMEENSEERPSV
eukprot:scaffold14139_cov74-Cyclotella_meneghiniana.AAC.22